MNAPLPTVDHWQLRSRRLAFERRPLVMGIVNVTPDSFSDGGKYFDAAAAIDGAMRLADDGADILDIGGESTRPYSKPVDADEELRRVLPVIQAIVKRTNVPVSIDTSKAVVARAALDAGAEIINDVTALGGDPAMLRLAIDSQAGVCAMHMQGTPQTMQDAPTYINVVADIHGYLAERRDQLLAAGIEPHRIGLDPGIGFGKTHQHNLDAGPPLPASFSIWAARVLLVGHSRKAFIGKVMAREQARWSDAERTFGTLGVSLALAAQGVHVLRVHDVAATRQALALFSACGGIDGKAAE